MRLKIILWLAALLGAVSRVCADSAVTNAPARVFNIREFGAKGDGVAKDTAAVQAALDACAAAGGGTVLVPAGNYLIGSVRMGGRTRLEMERNANFSGSADVADYPLERVRWEGEFVSGHRALISATNAADIAITGPGAVFGPPLVVSRLRNPRGPALMEFMGCTNVLLERFTTQYQQLWSIHPVLCSHFTARGLAIHSVNFNGDGIDVDSCSDVLIEGCSIDTGDDAVSLKSGRGLAAVQLGRPTERVVIRDCTLASSIFAGLGIGTEMSGGVRDVRLENCIIAGRKNGILIKSREGRGGFIENIAGSNLTVISSPNFLVFDLLKRGIQATDPVTNAVEKWPLVRNIRFTDVRVAGVRDLVRAVNVPAERPVDGLVLSNITGTCQRAIMLNNVQHASIADVRVTGFAGELVTTNAAAGADAP